MNARCLLAIISIVAVVPIAAQGPAGKTAGATEMRCADFGSTPETRGKLVTPPAVLNEVHPKYPLSARRSHIEGIVVLCVTIDKDGSARNVRVMSGPKELVPSAVEAVQRSRFRPTLADGEPVNASVIVLLDFRLTGIQVRVTSLA